MLLPLPISLVQEISLENHMALALMRSGRGTSATMCVMLRILYMLFYMLEGDYRDIDIPRFLEMEAALDKSIREANSGRGWRFDEQSFPVIASVLLRFDEVVGTVPASVYHESAEKMARFARSASQSPIPGSRVCDMWLIGGES